MMACAALMADCAPKPAGRHPAAPRGSSIPTALAPALRRRRAARISTRDLARRLREGATGTARTVPRARREAGPPFRSSIPTPARRLPNPTCARRGQCWARGAARRAARLGRVTLVDFREPHGSVIPPAPAHTRPQQRTARSARVGAKAAARPAKPRVGATATASSRASRLRPENDEGAELARRTRYPDATGARLLDHRRRARPRDTSAERLESPARANATRRQGRARAEKK
jgi:hypothetical protein